MRYGQDNSVFANMDMYRIENVVCYPFRTATLVDNETIEDQIGEGCKEIIEKYFLLNDNHLHLSGLDLSRIVVTQGHGWKGDKDQFWGIWGAKRCRSCP